jgi:hypothetical protein
MAKQHRTIYQELTSFLNFDSFSTSKLKGSNQPKDDHKVLLKGDSPEQLQAKALELQQKEYLSRNFGKVQEHGFQKAMQFEATRYTAFQDYEGMEFYPLISAALDLLRDEATTIGPNGKMVNVYSSKDRIKGHIEDFLYGTLNVNVNLPAWTRNLCKYGDNFLYIYGERGQGITYVKQLVNQSMERKDIFDKDTGRIATKFKIREGSTEFENIEIAHFRLLGDDKYQPYGSSILNKIRRVWRQLVMAEDAMLTYRILRAGEKRVFKIPVGNMDEADIQAYVDRVIVGIKKAQQVNPTTGNIDYRFNITGNDEDIFIPVRGENTGTVIDTLPGAQNLDAIHDIEYLRDNMFMGLGIPRPFLSYQSAGGEGKNMAQFDVRFSKKINTIQQAIIQELNKMIMIHLHYLGFRGDELSDFKITLTNPSTQSEILRMELLELKSRVYKELTSSDNGSIAAFSHTWAMRNIFNQSDREILQDMKMQRIEKAISQELQNTPFYIKQTGIFDDIDKKFGGIDPAEVADQIAQNSPPPGGDGGSGLGGGLDNLGGDLGGGGAPDLSAGGAPTGGAMGNQAESVVRKQNFLNEAKNSRLDNLFDRFEQELFGDKKTRQNFTDGVSSENKSLNEKAFQMIAEAEVHINKNVPFKEETLEGQYRDSDEDYRDFLNFQEELLRDQVNSLNENIKTDDSEK